MTPRTRIPDLRGLLDLLALLVSLTVVLAISLALTTAPKLVKGSRVDMKVENPQVGLASHREAMCLTSLPALYR